MTDRGAAKYYTVHTPLDDTQLTAHLAGFETYAAPLIGRDGMASAGVIELDVGAEDAAVHALNALAGIGVTAFSFITPGSGGHNGSHTWVLYHARGDPEPIRAQLHQAAESAGLPSREIFPTNQAIRLPFGLHRRSHCRGTLLLQDGRRFDLDRGGLPEAMAALATLPRNTLPRNALSPPTLPPSPRKPVERPMSLSTGQVIGDYCRATDLIDLLARYPGYQVISRTAGRAVLRCGCPHHTHGDRRPSLEVKAGRDGRQVLLGYAPACIWHNEHGRNDAFNVLCALEHLSPRDAVKQLVSSAPIQPQRYPPHPGETPTPKKPAPDEATLENRRRDAKRKRERRRAATQSIRSAVEAHLASDADLSARGRIVLRALLDVAGERDWCRPSVARLVEMTGYSERTVQYALTDLERSGYIRSTPVRAGTTYRHILAPVAMSGRTQHDQPSPVSPVAMSETAEGLELVAQPGTTVALACPTEPIAPIEMSNLPIAAPDEEIAPVEASAGGTVAPESGKDSESEYKQEACEREGAAHSVGVADDTALSKPSAESPANLSQAQQSLWGSPVSVPANQPRRQHRSLPRRAWAEADIFTLEQELRRRQAMLRHMRRGPARSSVERVVYQLSQCIATRRDIGLAVMCYGNAEVPRQVDHPRCIAEGQAVVFEGGASFIPPGASADALLEKLQPIPPVEDSGGLSPPGSQALGSSPAPHPPISSGALPAGWRVERCDHKGNLSAYGCYWIARGPDRDTEPTMYLDTAYWQARRAAEAHHPAGGAYE